MNNAPFGVTKKSAVYTYKTYIIHLYNIAHDLMYYNYIVSRVISNNLPLNSYETYENDI